jgi:D-alanyl-D-alanine carboxypeptidase/D-alanyl-D-alanine-endopeptidase (penicillin-binding protein 4)
MKLFTSAAALLFLPEVFQFTTSVYYTGLIIGDTLHGDLHVIGGLDPAFSSGDLDTLADDIQLLNLKFISGNIYADLSIKDSLYWGRGWMWDDDPDPTAPYLSALNINDNVIEVFVKAAGTGTKTKVIITPETDFVSVENNSLVSSYLPTKLKITRSWVDRKNNIIIDGIVKAGAIIDSSDHKEKLNVLYPEKYFLTMLKEKLYARGILCNGNLTIAKLPPQSKLITSFIHSVDSVLLSAINKDSDNLRAEMLLYALALSDSGAPASAKNGIEAINKLVDTIGFNRNDYSFADGSGVSRYNLISSELITGLLKFIYKQKQFKSFHNSLSIAGVDGTLKKRMIGTEAENNLHAKTGTLAGVSALSGYITAKNGNLLAFSILMQNFVEKMPVARNIQNRICELLANYE